MTPAVVTGGANGQRLTTDGARVAITDHDVESDRASYLTSGAYTVEEPPQRQRAVAVGIKLAQFVAGSWPYTATTTVRAKLFSDHTPMAVLLQSCIVDRSAGSGHH